MSDQLEEAQKNRDNELKIAILNFFSKSSVSRLKMVWKNEKNPNPMFEEIYEYLKSL